MITFISISTFALALALTITFALMLERVRADDKEQSSDLGDPVAHEPTEYELGRCVFRDAPKIVVSDAKFDSVGMSVDIWFKHNGAEEDFFLKTGKLTVIVDTLDELREMVKETRDYQFIDCMRNRETKEYVPFGDHDKFLVGELIEMTLISDNVKTKIFGGIAVIAGIVTISFIASIALTLVMYFLAFYSCIDTLVQRYKGNRDRTAVPEIAPAIVPSIRGVSPPPIPQNSSFGASSSTSSGIRNRTSVVSNIVNVDDNNNNNNNNVTE